MNEKIALKEVYDILRFLGTNYISKIPPKMYNCIVENKDENYITDIHENTNFEELEISKEALEIIAYINYQYWCNDSQKKELRKKYNNEIEKKAQSYNAIFAKNNNIAVEEVPKQSEELVIKKEGILDRIKDFLQNFFKKK